MSVFRTKKVQIVRCLEQCVPELLCHLQMYDVISFEERERIEKATGSSKDILLSLIRKLEVKDGGLRALLVFLRKNDMNTFASYLELTAKELSADSSTSDDGPLDQFLSKLALYYKRSSNVWIPNKNSKSVGDVYVPLSLLADEKSESAPVAVSSVLQELRNDDCASVIIIKGNPGTGKTTLMAHLAYDWAEKRLSGRDEKNTFAVVLHVKLKSAPAQCSGILAMALEHLLKAVSVRSVPQATLVQLIEDMGSRVVVLLDGLDEYNTANTELGNIFAPKFDTSAKNNEDPPRFLHKLVVATRPYACRVINQNFAVATYNVVSLTPEQRLKFSGIYCDNEKALSKVNSYLTLPEAAVLPVQTPLVLLFVCFLADYDEELPTRRTKLYERCLYHMMQRAVKVKAEMFDEDIVLTSAEFAWTCTNVAQKTSELAVVCCSRNLPSIEQSVLVDLTVPNDSFTCGYLLYKFDFGGDCFMAEFPHRSLQEFFAALNCYELIIVGNASKAKKWLGDLMYRYDEISMFLMGIASSRGTFQNVATSILATASSGYELLQLNLIVPQNESNADIRPEELRFLKKQEESCLARVHPSLFSSSETLTRLNSVSDRSDRTASFLSSIRIADFVYIAANFSECAYVPTDSATSGFIACSDMSDLLSFINSVSRICETVGILETTANILSFSSYEFSHLISDNSVLFIRAVGKSMDVYIESPEFPRIAKFAGTWGDITTVWMEKFDSIHNYDWLVDQSEFLQQSINLNLLPDDLRVMSINIGPLITTHDRIVKKFLIQYRTLLPKPLKRFRLSAVKSILLDKHIRAAELHPGVSCRIESGDQITVEVTAECERHQLVLNMIRFAVELQCSTTFVEQDLD